MSVVIMLPSIVAPSLITCFSTRISIILSDTRTEMMPSNWRWISLVPHYSLPLQGRILSAGLRKQSNVSNAPTPIMFRPSVNRLSPTMPSADFCLQIKLDRSNFSSSLNNRQTSRGNALNFRRVNAQFIKRIPLQMEGFVVTCPLAPNTSHLILDSCSSPRDFALDFLQTLPHDNALALSLTFGSANTWYQNFHLTS